MEPPSHGIELQNKSREIRALLVRTRRNGRLMKGIAEIWRVRGDNLEVVEEVTPSRNGEVSGPTREASPHPQEDSHFLVLCKLFQRAVDSDVDESVLWAFSRFGWRPRY